VILSQIHLPESYNYIACFLTLDCNLKCGYCINSFGAGNKFKIPLMPGRSWIEGMNRLVCHENLPVTIQGGEPGLHPDFISIIKNIKEDLNIDILTNLSFNVDDFIKELKPSRLNRNAPYPNIRASYHPSHTDLNDFINRVAKIQRAGFSIGVFVILHPQFQQEITELKKRCLDLGIDCRTKEFLGEFNGKMHGAYLYPEAVGDTKRKKCLCRTSELIIGPDGNVFRCHHDLYKNFPPVGNLLEPDFKINDIFRECAQFGDCNPCDIKIKTNRFQVYGHTSVEIKDIGSVYCERG